VEALVLRVLLEVQVLKVLQAQELKVLADL
jgi:hypothetical protein